MTRLSCSFVAFFLMLAFNIAVEVSNVTALDTTAASYRPTGGEGSLRPGQCAGACDFRCSKTHHRSACVFACNMCCQKCLCVPSGTVGNKEECPCYNNWKTDGNKPKCP